MTRALVTGTQGWIGWHLACALHVKELPVCEPWHADLTPGDVVYHLGWRGTPARPADPFYEAKNLETTFALAQKCAAAGARLVFMSSAGALYGAGRYLPIGETYPTNPRTPYGVAKLAAENYIRVTPGLDWVILRPSCPYGERQPVDRGQGVIAIFLDRAIRREPIEIYGEFSITRDFFHVDDLVRACLLAADAPSGIYNIGGGVPISLEQVLKVIGSLVGDKPKVRLKLPRYFDPHTVVLDCSSFQRATGWQPTVGIKEGINRMMWHAMATQEARA